MRKIIDGKVYDTRSAERLGSWCNGRYRGDFSRCEEALYRTTRGAYFIAGSGGPMSCYAEDCGDGRCGGEGLRVVTETEARKWMEDRCDPDDYEAAFGAAEVA